MRLIDSDALIQEWYRVNNIDEDDRGARFVGYTEIPKFIANAPTVMVDGDYISRADAIEAVCKLCPERKDKDCECKDFCLLYDSLSALPSAEATCATCADRAVCIMSAPDGQWKACKDYHPSAESVQGYAEWLEKIIVEEEIVRLCEDTNDKEWCEKNCKYPSIQAECLRHLYEVSKGGDPE